MSRGDDCGHAVETASGRIRSHRRERTWNAASVLLEVALMDPSLARTFVSALAPWCSFPDGWNYLGFVGKLPKNALACVGHADHRRGPIRRLPSPRLSDMVHLVGSA